MFPKEPHIDTEAYREAMASGIPLTGTNADYIAGVNQYPLALAKELIRKHSKDFNGALAYDVKSPISLCKKEKGKCR